MSDLDDFVCYENTLKAIHLALPVEKILPVQVASGVEASESGAAANAAEEDISIYPQDVFVKRMKPLVDLAGTRDLHIVKWAISNAKEELETYYTIHGFWATSLTPKLFESYNDRSVAIWSTRPTDGMDEENQDQDEDVPQIERDTLPSVLVTATQAAYIFAYAIAKNKRINIHNASTSGKTKPWKTIDASNPEDLTAELGEMSSDSFESAIGSITAVSSGYKKGLKVTLAIFLPDTPSLGSVTFEDDLSLNKAFIILLHKGVRFLHYQSSALHTGVEEQLKRKAKKSAIELVLVPKRVESFEKDSTKQLLRMIREKDKIKFQQETVNYRTEQTILNVLTSMKIFRLSGFTKDLRFEMVDDSTWITMNAAAQSALDIAPLSQNGKDFHHLLRVSSRKTFATNLVDMVDTTSTAGGRAALISMMSQPLANVETIEQRQQVFAALRSLREEQLADFQADLKPFGNIREILKSLYKKTEKPDPSSILKLLNNLRGCMKQEEHTLNYAFSHIITHLHSVFPHDIDRPQDVLKKGQEFNVADATIRAIRLKLSAYCKFTPEDDSIKYCPENTLQYSSITEEMEGIKTKSEGLAMDLFEACKGILEDPNEDFPAGSRVELQELVHVPSITTIHTQKPEVRLKKGGVIALCCIDGDEGKEDSEPLKKKRRVEPALAGPDPQLQLTEALKKRLESTSELKDITFVVAQDDRYVLCRESIMSNLEVLANLSKKRDGLLLEVKRMLTEHLQTNCKFLYNVADAIDHLDAWFSMASFQPTVHCQAKFDNNADGIIAQDFVHPLMVKRYDMVPSARRPIANSIKMRFDKPISLVTGINASGKSTLLKALGQIVHMAHVGLLIPATELRLPVLSSILVRVGAGDDTVMGLSTFESEMVQLVDVVNGAAAGRNLIIIDELGRGTSNREGTALAHASLKHLAQQTGQSLILCATHLTALQTSLAPLASNYKFGHSDDLAPTFELEAGVHQKGQVTRLMEVVNFPPNTLIDAKLLSKSFDVATSNPAYTEKVTRQLKPAWEDQFSKVRGNTANSSDDNIGERPVRHLDNTVFIHNKLATWEMLCASIDDIKAYEETPAQKDDLVRAFELQLSLQHAVRAMLADEDVEKDLPKLELNVPEHDVSSDDDSQDEDSDIEQENRQLNNDENQEGNMDVDELGSQDSSDSSDSESDGDDDDEN